MTRGDALQLPRLDFSRPRRSARADGVGPYALLTFGSVDAQGVADKVFALDNVVVSAGHHARLHAAERQPAPPNSDVITTFLEQSQTQGQRAALAAFRQWIRQRERHE